MKVIQMGLGPIGLQVIKYITERDGVELVAAVDKDPQKSSKLLSELCDFSEGMPSAEVSSIPVHPTLSEALAVSEPDIAIITTVSDLERMEPQIKEAAECGLDIVSTCEELTFSYKINPSLTERIDQVCIQNEVSCLGTGVNPGFLMDYLPAVMTSVSRRVDHITVERIQNAAFRRGPFQSKIGVNMTPDEFESKKESISHVGLPESTYMIAKAVHWDLDEVRETINPVIAKNDVSSQGVNVPSGKVLGVEQIARGLASDQEVIKLIFRAAIGEAKSHDTIKIEGEPSFESVIDGGVNGDIATAAITVNAIPSVLKAGPGLKTMLEIPVPACFSGAQIYKLA